MLNRSTFKRFLTAYTRWFIQVLNILIYRYEIHIEPICFHPFSCILFSYSYINYLSILFRSVSICVSVKRQSESEREREWETFSLS